MSFTFIELKIFLLLVIALAHCDSLADTNKAKEMMEAEEEFHAWKEQYGKTYKSPEEEQRRMGIWLNSKKLIKEHNEKYARGETTFTMKLNHFGDLLRRRIQIASKTILCDEVNQRTLHPECLKILHSGETYPLHYVCYTAFTINISINYPASVKTNAFFFTS